MLGLYVGGKRIGDLAQAEQLIHSFASGKLPIELRGDTGEVLGTIQPNIPGQFEAEAPLIPWDPTITKADLERIAGEPGCSFEEVRQRLGWA